MAEAFAWWLTLEILGIIAFPVAAVLLRALPDRGYTVTKTLGLLLTGWLAYTLSMMQMAQFGRGLLIFCAIVLALFSTWLLWRKGKVMLAEMQALLRTRSFVRYLAVTEVIFTVAFILWTLLRAYDPDIFSFEKFMDFGIMNAIAKSSTFPPNDMWLSGHSINYYYFGYVLMTSLSLLSVVPTQIGFNLANVTLFALTAVGSFGVAYNLVASSATRLRENAVALQATSIKAIPKRRARSSAQAASATTPASRLPVRQASVATAAPVALQAEAPIAVAEPEVAGNGHSHDASLPPNGPRYTTPAYEAGDAPAEPTAKTPWFLSPYLYATLAMLMVVAMGNLTTMFAIHDGPQTEGDGWRYCFNCQTAQTFNWFAPSRVIRDYRTATQPGQPPNKEMDPVESINEFPAFSLLLADLHPHVMALPLVLLALACALAFSRRRVLRGQHWRDGLPRGLHAWLSLAVVGIIIGSLYTTNTWDYPTYLLMALAGLALAYLTFQRQSERACGWRWLQPWIVQSALIVVLSLVSFILFHLTFKSLVGGQPAQVPENLANIPIVGWVLQKLGSYLLVNTWDKTITGFLVIFGIFLVGIVGWFLYELTGFSRRPHTEPGRPPTTARNNIILGVVTLLSLAFAFLLRFPLLALLLSLAVVAFYLAWREPQRIERNMALVMVGLGALIGLVIEVVYLRDVFNDRQNTLFKFYYQIWILWALASAYGLWRVLRAAFTPREAVPTTQRGTYPPPNIGSKALALAWTAVFGLLVLSGLMYSIYGPLGKLGPTPVLRGLDGATHLSRSAPGDYAAINWLKANATGSDVVLECCHDEYNAPGHAGRVSSYTGVSTLISWDGHESQWRGGQPQLLAELGPRRNVVTSLYTAKDPANNGAPLTPQRLLEVLHQYNIDYVFVGAVERGEGNAAGGHPEERVTPQAEALFKQVLQPAFTSGSTVIYRVPQPAAQANPSGPRP